jgi:hypothetical protein
VHLGSWLEDGCTTISLRHCLPLHDLTVVPNISKPKVGTGYCLSLSPLIIFWPNRLWSLGYYKSRHAHLSGMTPHPRARAQVVVRRERLCVAVRAGRQGDLPRGSLNLASSSTGATFYIDPAPTVPLNNAEARLAGEEAAEEAAVLARLSSAVAGSASRIHQVTSPPPICEDFCAILGAGNGIRARFPAEAPTRRHLTPLRIRQG